jgi:hypothetical protein
MLSATLDSSVSLSPVFPPTEFTIMALSFPSKAHHIAAVYDACALILDTYKETDLFKVYSDEGLEDHIDFAATAREIMGLIAEGDIK